MLLLLSSLLCTTRFMLAINVHGLLLLPIMRGLLLLLSTALLLLLLLLPLLLHLLLLHGLIRPVSLTTALHRLLASLFFTHI
jgi:hypothetical protein